MKPTIDPRYLRELARYTGGDRVMTEALQGAADKITKLESQLAAEREEMTAPADILPSSIYLDPPDGGSVTIIEQFKRMALDADRYRWLIKASSYGVTERQQAVLYLDRSVVAPDHQYDLTDAIDTARKQATAPEQEGGVMPDITKCVNRKCPKCELCYRFTAPASEFWQLYDLFKPNSSGVCTEFVAKHARHNLGGVEP